MKLDVSAMHDAVLPTAKSTQVPPVWMRAIIARTNKVNRDGHIPHVRVPYRPDPETPVLQPMFWGGCGSIG